MTKQVVNMQCVQKYIAQNIETKPKRTLLFREDFINYGSSEAAHQPLVRLQNKALLFM